MFLIIITILNLECWVKVKSKGSQALGTSCLEVFEARCSARCGRKLGMSTNLAAASSSSFALCWHSLVLFLNGHY